MSDQQLMNHLRFDESDLRVNRNGGISEKQKVRLQKVEADAKRGSLLGSVGNFFIALIGLGAAAVCTYEMMKNDLGLRPQAQHHTRNIIALLFEQSRGHRRIHTARHGDDNFLFCHKLGDYTARCVNI